MHHGTKQLTTIYHRGTGISIFAQKGKYGGKDIRETNNKRVRHLKINVSVFAYGLIVCQIL